MTYDGYDVLFDWHVTFCVQLHVNCDTAPVSRTLTKDVQRVLETSLSSDSSKHLEQHSKQAKPGRQDLHQETGFWSQIVSEHVQTIRRSHFSQFCYVCQAMPAATIGNLKHH